MALCGDRRERDVRERRGAGGRERRGRERECELALGLWCEMALSWPRVSNNHIQRPSTFYLFTLQPLHASTSSRWQRQGGGAER